MASPKEIIIQPISSSDGNRICKRYHYSGRVVPNSQIHLGVFLNGKCEGVMQFGPSMDKSKVIGLVSGTKWNGFLELNRMAFSNNLPRNSESRALSVAFRILKKQYPFIEWILSYSDATQAGDGTIYRASGFVLTGIRENKTILKLPTGEIVADLSLNVLGAKTGKTAGWWKKNGAVPLKGFQLRYIYFLNPGAKQRLAVPILPFSKIDEAGARMYLGKRASSVESGTAGFQPEGGGESPTDALHIKDRL